MKYPLLARGLIEEYQEQKYFTRTPKDSSGTRKMLDSNGDELIPDFPLQLAEQYNAQIACAKESVDKFREQRIHKIADLLCFFILQLGFTKLDDARKCLKSYKRLKYELAIVTLLTNYPMVPFLGNLATTLPQLYYLPFTENTKLQMTFDEGMSFRVLFFIFLITFIMF